MHVFTTVIGVTKTDILCAVIEHNAYANMFQTRRKWNKTKQKIHNLFGFYSTRKWVLKSTTRFTLTLSALNIDPSNLYHILWVPNRLKEC